MEYLDNLYSKHGVYSLMVVSHLLDIGFSKAEKITDEEIAKQLEQLKVQEKEDEKSGKFWIMSAEFQMFLVEEARNIAKNVTIVDLLIWFEKNKPYEIPKKGRKR